MGTLPSHLSPFEGTLLEMASGEYLFADLWPELSLMATPRCKGGRAFWLGTLPLRHWLVKQSSLPPEAKKILLFQTKSAWASVDITDGTEFKKEQLPHWWSASEFRGWLLPNPVRAHTQFPLILPLISKSFGYILFSFLKNKEWVLSPRLPLTSTCSMSLGGHPKLSSPYSWTGKCYLIWRKCSCKWD